MSIASFLNKVRLQTAIYWGSPSPDGFGGFSFSAPVDITCRWDDLIENIVNVLGEEITTRSRIISDRVLETGGFLKLGSVDSSTPSSPEGLDGAFRIQRFDKIPDIHNQTTVYIAYL